MCKINFNTNIEKALEVILYLSYRVKEISFHKLVKILFFADIYHLNKYGRPIIGDNYIAMKFGPVASTVYDILEKDDFTIEALSEVPFQIERKSTGGRIIPIVIPERDYNPDELSISDEEALNYAVNKYKNYSFSELTELSHQHPGWYKAWQRRGCSKSSPIHYTDLIEPGNKELVKELEEHSQYMCL